MERLLLSRSVTLKRQRGGGSCHHAWRSYRAGRNGAGQVVGQLRQVLDQRWTIYRNLYDHQRCRS